jgi:hypothetical protein
MARTSDTQPRRSRVPPVPGEEALHVNRNLLVAGGLLIACATGWWSIRAGADDAALERDTRAALEASSDSASSSASGVDAAEVPVVPGAAVTESELQFQRYVDDKYRLLFRDVEGDAATALRTALQQRERLVAQINTARQTSDAALRETLPALEARKAESDRGIGTLLPASELGAFEALKDSDIERFQVEDYAAGIQNVAPLAEADKQSVLATKLAYRERFRRVLADSRLMTGDLNGTERLLAFNEVSRALREYQQSYLQEVRQYLYNDEQYGLLSNYESSEFDAEMARLRSIAGLE